MSSQSAPQSYPQSYGHYLRQQGKYRAEYVARKTSTCKTCGHPIPVNTVRIAIVINRDQYTEYWRHHIQCFFDIYGESKDIKVDDIDRLSRLKHRDQMEIIGHILSHGNGRLIPDDWADAALQEQSKRLYRHFRALNQMKREDLLLLMDTNTLRVAKSKFSRVYTILDAMTFGVPQTCSQCNTEVSDGGQLVFRRCGYICSMGSKTTTLECDYFTLQPIRTHFVVPVKLTEKYSFLKEYRCEPRDRIYIPALTDAMKSYQRPVAGSQVMNTNAGIYMDDEDTDGTESDIGDIDANNRDRELDFMDTDDIQDSELYRIEDLIQRVGENEESPLPSVRPHKVLKGGEVVDTNCPLDKGCYEVLRDWTGSYSATLANVKLFGNKNYFYNLQLLYNPPIAAKYYSVWLSWGTIGGSATGCVVHHHINKVNAIQEFKQKFFDKTNNVWENWSKELFKQNPYKYSVVDIKYIERMTQMTRQFNLRERSPEVETEVHRMLLTIFDFRNMLKQFIIKCKIENFDLDKVPLGIIRQAAIKDSWQYLQVLHDLVHNPVANATDIEHNSNLFYQNIPHITTEVINTYELIRRKFDLLNDLLNLKITYDLIGDTQLRHQPFGPLYKPIDYLYAKLNTRITLLDKNDKDYKFIEQLIIPSNRLAGYMPFIKKLFRFDGHESDQRFRSQKPNLKHLWHGTRVTNLVDIIAHGMSLDSGAQTTGHRYGNGIYFTDVAAFAEKFTKSDEIVDNEEDDEVYEDNDYTVDAEIVWLLVCEVDIGHKLYEVYSKNELKRIPQGVSCVQLMGKYDMPTRYTCIQKGTSVGVWKAQFERGRFVTYINHKGKEKSLNYNSYLVKDPAKINVKFLVKVQKRFPPTNGGNVPNTTTFSTNLCSPNTSTDLHNHY